jgi:hypothetical protein
MVDIQFKSALERPVPLKELPHRVARTHLGTMDRNPCAFATVMLARPLPIFGLPVHPWDRSLDYNPVVLLKPFGPHHTVDALPSNALLHRPVKHYPHVWISTRGLGSSGTLTHLKRLLPGTHYELHLYSDLCVN